VISAEGSTIESVINPVAVSKVMSQIFNKLYEQAFIDFYMSNAMWWNCAENKTWAEANLISLDCST
jgi:hypothetical protein